MLQKLIHTYFRITSNDHLNLIGTDKMGDYEVIQLEDQNYFDRQKTLLFNRIFDHYQTKSILQI